MLINNEDEKLIIIIVILLITIISLFVIHYFTIRKDIEEGKKNNVEIKEKKDLDKEYITNYVKNYMLSNNLAHQNNIDTWEINTVKLYKYNQNKYFYSLEGFYRCIEGYDCIYQSQVNETDTNDNYSWTVVVEYDINNKKLRKVYGKEYLFNGNNVEEISILE